jgi:hypothetical protein
LEDFVKKRSRVLAAVVGVFFCLSGFNISFAKTNLESLNWYEKNYKTLGELVKKYSNGCESVQDRPYAVFDFDDTTIFGDTECKRDYQIENLLFKISPDVLYEAMVNSVPKDDFDANYNNLNGESVNIEKVAADIVSDYKFLYANYEGMDGTMPLDEIKNTLQYEDFSVKCKYLFYAISDTFGNFVLTQWMTWYECGFTEEESENIVVEAFDCCFSNSDLDCSAKSSPSELPGKAGVLSAVTCYNVKSEPEIVNLIQTLEDSNIEVYICSTSLQNIILPYVTNPKYGLNIKPENVFTTVAERDENGKFVCHLKNDYVNCGENKARTIENFIKPRQNGQDPILVAGDSNGDYYMLTEFSGLKIGLIINTNQTGLIQNLYAKARAEKDFSLDGDNTIYLLQGRNDNAGTFIASQDSLKLGEFAEIMPLPASVENKSRKAA